MNPEHLADAEEYVRRIKNKEKKAYARRYLDWLLGGQAGEEPESSISYMARQGVRIALYELLPELKSRPANRAQ